MSRYDLPGGPDHEFEPGSDNRVLRNSEYITDPRVAESREAELLLVAFLDSLQWTTVNLKFTADILQEMHRLWLGSLYPMAGQYRTVNMSKGGFPFCNAQYISREMKRFEREELAENTPCPGLIAESERARGAREAGLLTVGDIAYKVAVVHAELLLIHPFREGNGRLGRWLADLMVLQCGHEVPTYDLDDLQKRERYYAAMRKGYKGELKDLTALFVSWIEGA